MRALFETAARQGATLLVCPTTVKDVFYLLPRHFRRQDTLEGTPIASYEAAAWGCVECMLDLAAPSPLGLFECALARTLRSKFPDYEDNLLLASGESAQIDYLVTNDNLLLQRFPEACITPTRAIGLM